MVVDSVDPSSLPLYGLDKWCTIVELLDGKPLGFPLGCDISEKYVVVSKLPCDESVSASDCHGTGRKLSVGDVLFSINEHMTLSDDISDILLFLDTLEECGLDQKLTFLDPSKVAEASHLQAKSLNKDLLGFSRDLDYLLGEKVYNNANINSTAQRDLEWVAYLKHIGGPDNLKPAGNFEPSSELKYMVRRGIPAAFRSLIWQKVSLSSIHRTTYPSDYYSDLLGRSHNLNKKVADDIEKDVKRTFPEHDYFDRGSGGDGLRRVLTSYALHNPSVGYCQSLNFIVGMMLLFLQEEDAFWLLVTVVDTLLPEDCYSKSMIGTHVDQYVFARIIETSMPKLQSALTKTQMDLSLVTVPWFMCLFVNTFRPEVTLRVWDMFFCEGSKVLFRISAALLKKNEVALVAASTRDSMDLFMEMKNIGRNELDADALIAMAYKSYTPPTSKQRGMFTSRSTSTLATSTWRGPVDPPARKYNEFSGVPSDLIGIGVAHTGPVLPPVVPSIPAIPSTSSISSIPSIPSTSPISSKAIEPIEKIESLSLEEIELHNESQIAKEIISQKNIIFNKETVSLKSNILLKKDISHRKVLGIRTEIDVNERNLDQNPESFPSPCLSLFQAPNTAVAVAKVPIVSIVQEESDEMKNCNSDCCFDKGTASAMLQLGRSAFKPSFINNQEKTVILMPSTYSTTADTSPSSVMDVNSPFYEPSLRAQKLDLLVTSSAVSSPMLMIGSASAAYQRKVKVIRNPSSLLNMILNSNIANNNQNNDQYRNFKRADIDRLREEFRPILMERFLSLEKIHLSRYGPQYCTSSTSQSPSV